MTRNDYGEIMKPMFTNANPFDTDLYNEALCLIQTAVSRKKIPASYDTVSFDHKRRADGEALHHEIYDISDDGRHVLLCIRETEGNKYGVKTVSKEYKILSAHGKNGVRVTEASKAKAAKAAKQAGREYGHAIAVCLGKKKLSVPATKKRICYKIVARENSDFVSVYDGSPWSLNKTRREKSSMNHESGFYVFPNMETAMTAWEKRVAFKDEWLSAEKYALLECECAGREFTHDNGKICISMVKPVAEVAGLLQ